MEPTPNVPWDIWGRFHFYPYYYLLSLKISLAAPRLLKALVASKGINTLLASPLAISSRASRDFI